MTENTEKKSSLFGRLFGGEKANNENLNDEKISNEKPNNEKSTDLQLSDTQLSDGQSNKDSNKGEDLNEQPPEKNATLQEHENTTTAEQQEPEQNKQAKQSWFGRLKSGLSKSSAKLSEGITSLFTKAKLDEETLQDLEDLLIQADLGVDTAMRITDKLSEARHDKNISAEDVSKILADEIEKVLKPVAHPLKIDPANTPHVILTIGVNGAGKTTTIGKLAQKFVSEGKRVMLAAGDTFRAAAIEQLKIWGERTNSPVIAHDQGADAASLAFEALKKAKEEASDVLLIDTAGRLQNKANLMAELEKIVRVLKKFDENAPHTVLLVLDATTGQNALNQVEIFSKSAHVTGLIMTKLDGTARGGILVAIANKYALPVYAIGVGEGVDDLQAFDASEFATAIAAR